MKLMNWLFVVSDKVMSMLGVELNRGSVKFRQVVVAGWFGVLGLLSFVFSLASLVIVVSAAAFLWDCFGKDLFDKDEE